MDWCGLVLLLATSLFFRGGQKQVQAPIEEPELIAGPWETVSATGIDGVFLQFVTTSSGPSGNLQIDQQTVDIRVYHRQDKKETWGWFSADVRGSLDSSDTIGPDIPTQFEGQRLRINFNGTTDLKPFVLDITFSPGAQKWSGTWSRAGQTFNVELERPNTNGDLKPSGFVGDWQGEAKIVGDSGSLHIRESRDGILSAWLDRTTSGTDPRRKTVNSNQRNGEFLRVYAMPGEGIILETANGVDAAYHYRATLSEDQQVITGNWSNGSGGRLSAPEKFRRVRIDVWAMRPTMLMEPR